jgi:hypothetical protein
VEVLIDRAQSIVQDLGYTQPPADIAYGYDLNVDYLQRIRDTDPSPMRWEVLRDDRMAPLKFWYRQSRQPLWPVWTPPSGPPGVVTLARRPASVCQSRARAQGFRVSPDEQTLAVATHSLLGPPLRSQCGVERQGEATARIGRSMALIPRHAAIWEVPVQSEPQIVLGDHSRVLHLGPYHNVAGAGRRWDVARDGRIVVIKPENADSERPDPGPERVNLVLGFERVIAERLPAN